MTDTDTDTGNTISGNAGSGSTSGGSDAVDASAAEQRDFIRVFKRFLELVNQDTSEDAPSGPTLQEHLTEFLGTDVSALSVVTETIAPHRLADADIALEELSGGRRPETLIGVSGGNQRHHSDFQELLSGLYNRFPLGPVDYAERAIGPASTRQVVAFGIWTFEFEGQRVAILQRSPAPQYGRDQITLELVAVDASTARAVLERVRTLMIERSVLRGQVLSFEATEYGQDAGATFVARPTIAADDIVLAPGVLDQVRQHVIGIGRHRAALLEAGQHLKRGVLLYGPPGTGKTLTVRHLISATEGTTAILLTGSSIRHIGAAAEIARTFQPSIVVLEDIDLVASDRDYSTGPQPLLFEVLDALDGLSGDADVTFLMTTNRVEVLESALSERPGRVDLAVEIPLPDLAARRQLFRRYAGSLPFGQAVLDATAARAEGTTGSFAKELMRRSVLSAAVAGAPVSDEHLEAALESLLSDRETLTRSLLGGGGGSDEEDSDGASGADDRPS